MLGTGRDKRIVDQRQARKGPKEDKGPPRWQQALSKGSARTTFVVGALLTLPGASYLAGLDQIEKQKLSTTATVLTVVGFNLIMLMLLELPLLGFAWPRTGPPGRSSDKGVVRTNGQGRGHRADRARQRAGPQGHIGLVS